jgi:hypothetical protein
MDLQLNRKEFYQDCTIGGFYIDGEFTYYSLEDTDRHLEAGGLKIPKETAIPRGRYKITISYSNRFQTMMPQLLDVPQFSGIRIHPGNTPVDTEGCILLGMRHHASAHNILESRRAFDDFHAKLIDGLKEGEVWIEVI